MEKAPFLRGLATISFYAADLDAARDWYTELLGVAPYFNVPGYTEFRIGDYQHELGIIDARFKPGETTATPGGAIAYWHVDDLQASLDRLLAAGAVLFQAITDHSGGNNTFVTASVTDPFGNVLGIMRNVHYLDMLEQKNNKANG